MLSSRSQLCTRCIHRLARPSSTLARQHPRALSLARSSHLPRTTTKPTSSTTSIRHYLAQPPLEPNGFAPPSPQSLGGPRPAKEYKRLRRWARRLAYLLLATGGIYVVDRTAYASALTRSARTFALGLLIAADYKINFRPSPPLASSIEAVHLRNAQRIFDLLRTNGGLYLKIGQAVAMQSAVLPPEFQKMFARMFDDAPQNGWEDVQRVIREDFGGRSVEEVFGVSFEGVEGQGVMERTARASASVAQVHWARLKDGREVAIKIQKREIEQQVGWDLWAFKVVAYVQSKIFDLPFYTLVPYITERLMLETDFENEAANSERMAKLVAGESRLNGRVYIPKVYHELSSKRVMTTEWIEGVRLWDKETMKAPWQGGWREGSPGVRGAPLDPPNHPDLQQKLQTSIDGKLKPERDWWKGPRGKGGLGVSVPDVMTTMVDLFSAQMFLWGWVHCDPHPGNIFIRRLPSGKPELVLIDHGLYIHMSTKFRHEYAEFWKSLLTFDNKAIKRIVGEWGVTNPDIFASATLLRPYTGGDNSTGDSLRKLTKGERQRAHYEMQQKFRKGMREILGDEDKWPRELIFIGRNLRIVQGNNQFLGSPVNRVKITGMWASRALVDSPDLSYAEKFKNLGKHVVFRTVLLGSDVVFWISKIRQVFGFGQGMEDDLEESMKGMAKEMGIELNHDVFDG